ncbi:PDC sensor domain-containing protein [Roseibium sp.]|uniref:PDC sensor domain-containing protein n=1 Tax=Roseibium sp. TaxID=1936156 RepID=UPI003D10710F
MSPGEWRPAENGPFANYHTEWGLRRVEVKENLGHIAKSDDVISATKHNLTGKQGDLNIKPYINSKILQLFWKYGERKRMKHFLYTTVACIAFVGVASANEFESELKQLANGKIAEIVSSGEVVSAVKEQNGVTASYDQAKIDELDKTWRAEADAIEQPMIDEVLEKPLSAHLAEIQEGSGGLFTEIFVMDAKGLNVGQSNVTSDFWQGDEAKWQETYSAGKGAVHISDLEQDDSTQIVQSQVSVPVIDPDSGEAIGAVTFGVNVDNL